MGTALTPTNPELPAVVETASTAVAAQAKAAVEARYIVAMRTPRNMDEVRVKLLQTCKRPGFAATAKYLKPVGNKKIPGLSIRFAEEVARQMGNLLPEVRVTFDDEKRRIVNVMVTDLESNLTYSQDIALEKTVERKDGKGREIVGERVNTYGDKVYIVLATEDELANKQGSAVSKVLRNLILRVLPGDIQDEATAQINETIKNEDAKDPETARKRLCDAFFDLGVMPAQLVEFLGHPLEQMNPAELQLLRNIFNGIRDGEGTWAEVMEQKGKKAEAPKTGNDALAGKLKSKKAEKVEDVDPDLALDQTLAEEDK